MPSKIPVPPKDVLVRLYEKHDGSATTMALERGVSVTTMLKWMRIHDLHILPQGNRKMYGPQMRRQRLPVRGKMKQALAWIENFLESGEKLVVFATHKATIHALEREYGTMAVKIDGSVPSEKRQAIVESFQNDPKVRLFIGNIKAAGVGITLTAASNVVFLELDWTPALLEQAEDRCHRIGQPNAVNIYYILAADTIDAQIAAMLERKRHVIDQITEDKNTTGFDLFETDDGTIQAALPTNTETEVA